MQTPKKYTPTEFTLASPLYHFGTAADCILTPKEHFSLDSDEIERDKMKQVEFLREINGVGVN